MNLKCLFCGILVGLYVEAVEAVNYTPEKISASISLKVPGNESEKYSLDMRQLKNDRSSYLLEPSKGIPMVITQRMEDMNGKLRINVSLTALEDVYFNFSEQLSTGSICRGSGIVAICDLLRKHLHFIHQTAGWYVRID